MMSLALVVLMGTGHAADVRLAWNASPEPDIAGYKIYYGTASRVYDWSIDAKKVTTFTVSGLADGRTYYFAVTAYDTSNLESTYSNEVSTSTCRYSISPPGQSFPASGGTGSINVSTQSACSWNASSNVSWMTITSGSRGTGNGTVYYSINANSDSSSRTASSTIAKNTFTVTQEGNSTTTYTITASAGTGGTISPTGTVTVSRNASRSFTITPSTGYSIDRVIVDGSSVGAVSTYTFSNVTANHTISASFKADTTTYTITASAGTGGTISPTGTVTVSRNASRSFTITPSTGYSIDRVIVDGSSVGAVS
ncbi:MAG TPA: fibronectin type III domain-containing protein, partial [Syntrophorhabdus sp.]|nr:fibronectin type III domain-containing protein [Syntrophorhabdus sp.]